ncbi:MAG: CDP-diacylglycerol--serine O-phosphatidyltransferase [Deltaproteobacteria bacterium]|nr:CDP-diacylglycerol--serine O-phosphatidyltransferase [Deltaproteobacteria bacterium]
MDIRKGKYIFPNLCTLGSIFFGLYAVISTADGTPGGFLRASFAIFMAVVCDSMDGRVARLTKTQTKFGIELDSLADVVSFGLAPAFLLYQKGFSEIYQGSLNPGILFSFIYLACGAMRLARFNVMADKKGGASNYFTGLPVPVAAGTVASIVIADHYSFNHFPGSVRCLAISIPLLSLLMVSTVKYRSFKKTGFTRRFVLSSLLLVLALIFIGIKSNAATAVLSGFMFYIFLGPAEYLYKFFTKRLHEKQEEIL